jgi:hypothetical protein
MKNKELFDLFRGFSEKDITEFDKYLKSPYFVHGKSLNKVFKEIINKREYLVDFNYAKLVSKVCRKLKYSSLTLGKQLSYLSKETINFLKLKSLENEILSSEVIFNEYLLNRHKTTVLKANFKKTESILKENSKITEHSYLNFFQNNVLLFNSQIECPGLICKNTLGNKNIFLNNALMDLMLYTLTQASSIYINYILVNFSLQHCIDGDFPLNLDNLFNVCDESSLFKEPGERKIIFELYRYMYLSFRSRKDVSFYIKYKNLVNGSSGILSNELMTFHYKVLINYCIVQERLGEDKKFYKNEGVELLMKYFENDYFKSHTSEFISRIEFKNFVASAFSIGKFENIKTFVEKNSTKLNPADYIDMVNFGLAYYYLGIKNFKKSLKYLNDISDGIPIIKFDVRNIEIRIYYELGMTETLIKSIHNYRTTILNDKHLTKSDKASLLTMLKYFNSLINILNKTEKAEIIDLASYTKQLIQKETFFALKSWLLEKFEIIEYSGKIKSASG